MPYQDDTLAGFNQLADIPPDGGINGGGEAQPSFAALFETDVLRKMRKTPRDYERELQDQYWERLGVPKGEKPSTKARFLSLLKEGGEGMWNMYQRHTLGMKDVGARVPTSKRIEAQAQAAYDKEQPNIQREASALTNLQRQREIIAGQAARTKAETESKERIAAEKEETARAKADNQKILDAARARNLYASAEWHQVLAADLKKNPKMGGDPILQDKYLQEQFQKDVEAGLSLPDALDKMAKTRERISQLQIAKNPAAFLAALNKGGAAGGGTTRQTFENVTDPNTGVTVRQAGSSSETSRSGGAAGPRIDPMEALRQGIGASENNAMRRYQQPGPKTPAAPQGAAGRSGPQAQRPSAGLDQSIAEQAYRKSGASVLRGFVPKDKAVSALLKQRESLHSNLDNLVSTAVSAWDSGKLEEITSPMYETVRSIKGMFGKVSLEESMLAPASFAALMRKLNEASGLAYSAKEIEMGKLQLPRLADNASNFLQQAFVTKMVNSAEELLLQLAPDPETKARIKAEAPARILDRISALLQRAKASRMGLEKPVQIADLEARTIFAEELKDAGYQTNVVRPKSVPASPAPAGKTGAKKTRLQEL